MTATALCGQRDALLKIIVRCFHNHIHAYLAWNWNANSKGTLLRLHDCRIHYHQNRKYAKESTDRPPPCPLTRENKILLRVLLAERDSPTFRDRVLLSCFLALRLGSATLSMMTPPTLRVIRQLSDLEATNMAPQELEQSGNRTHTLREFSNEHLQIMDVSFSRIKTVLRPPSRVPQSGGGCIISGCVYAEWGGIYWGCGGERYSLYLVEVALSESGIRIRHVCIATKVNPDGMQYS